MKKTLQYLSLGIALATCASCGSIATIDEGSKGPLQAMSDRLAAADQIAVTGIRRLDSQLIENKSVIGYGKVDLYVDRPDRVKAVVRGASNSRQFYLSSEGSVIYETLSGHYARFPGHPTIEKSLDAAAAGFGIHIPAQDFLSANPFRSLASRTDAISHLGVANVAGRQCDHIKGSREDLEWEMWIARSDNLPRRFAITVAGLNGRHHFQIDFMKWDLSPGLSADTFTFKPSKHDSEIEFLPPGTSE